jgi:hypothetical protein
MRMNIARGHGGSCHVRLVSCVRSVPNSSAILTQSCSFFLLRAWHSFGAYPVLHVSDLGGGGFLERKSAYSESHLYKNQRKAPSMTSYN